MKSDILRKLQYLFRGGRVDRRHHPVLKDRVFDAKTSRVMGDAYDKARKLLTTEASLTLCWRSSRSASF